MLARTLWGQDSVFPFGIYFPSSMEVRHGVRLRLNRRQMSVEPAIEDERIGQRVRTEKLHHLPQYDPVVTALQHVVASAGNRGNAAVQPHTQIQRHKRELRWVFLPADASKIVGQILLRRGEKAQAWALALALDGRDLPQRHPLAVHRLVDAPDDHAVKTDVKNNADSQHGPNRSEERRVGKECRSRWSPY